MLNDMCLVLGYSMEKLSSPIYLIRKGLKVEDSFDVEKLKCRNCFFHDKTQGGTT